jgi:hypothetical protein
LKKSLLCFFLVFFPVLFSFSQPFGNEWINYSQSYYKFRITADGVYRIDSTALSNAGIPLGSIDPRRFQIFGRGREIPIYVAGEGDGVFNSGDYIEFYAFRNDGFLDSLLYDTADITNPYHSLINDTAHYFLTWNLNSTNNLRFAFISDTTFSQYSPAPYFFRELFYTGTNEYQLGKRNVFGWYTARYDAGEGWTFPRFSKGNSNNHAYTTTNVYSGGPPAQFRCGVIGVSDDFTQPLNPDHQIQISYNGFSGNTQLADSLYNGFHQMKFSFTIPATNLTGSTNFNFLSVSNPLFTWGNLTAVSFSRLKYPHTFDLEGNSTYRMFIPDHPTEAKSLLNITNYNGGSGQVFLLDLTNRRRFEVFQNGPGFRVLVPNSGGEKFCFLFNNAQPLSITTLVPAGNLGLFTDFTNVNFDSAYIIVTHPVFWAESQQYANYRSSLPGGGFNVVMANITELYDQFAFGIKYHPASIRRFSAFAYANTNIKPSNLFLIGKDIQINTARNNASLLAQTYVPSMGYPASDNLLTAGLGNTINEPLIPTGRIAAKNPQNILDYLNKVIAHESNAPAEWMKQVMHFGGGSSTTEQSAFASFLSDYETIIEDTLFGGFVHTFLKSSSQPIQITLADSVERLINSGVSIMTFFGHASGNSFDQNLDFPGNYNNPGRHPLIIANSCYTGDIHQPTTAFVSSASETWVFTPNRGSIGFLASVGQGTTYYLNQISRNLYKQLGIYNYGNSIGKCLQAAFDTIQGNGSDHLMNASILEFTIHGDPAVIVKGWKKPDYAIADSSVFFSPKGTLTLDLDSFTIHVAVANLGKATSDTVMVEIRRIFPDNTDTVYTKPIPFVYYRDTLSLRLPIDIARGPGLNKFEVWVDSPQNIDELNENNNRLLNPATVLILAGDIFPVYPYKYAIIPNDTVVLKASTGNPFDIPRNYRFEVDTNDLFLAPLAVGTVLAPGGVVSWKAPLQLTDSTVYFWRVRRDTSDTTNFRWKESSFQYIPGKRGWEQAHFFQFKNDKYTYINYNRPARSFDFVPSGKTLIVNVYGQKPPNYNFSQMSATEYKLDLSVMDYAGCGFDTAIHIAVIDPISLTPWGNRYFDGNVMHNPTHYYNNANDIPSGGPCGRQRVENFFIYRIRNTTQMAGMKRMIEDSIPNGHFILAYSWINGGFSRWIDPSLFTTFENLGADSVRYLPNVPWIFFCKKGDQNSAIELWGDSANAFINLTTNLTNNSDFGTITSELIGPSVRWDSLSWRQHALENPPLDSVALNIIGIDNNGLETLVRSGLPPDSAQIYLSNINANQYPYLKLNLFIRDDSLRTCAQLDKWQVFFQPVPEIAVHPPLGFSFYRDTLQEGDSVRFSVAVKNISEFPIDSFPITFWVKDKNNATRPLPGYLSKPLGADSFLLANTKFSTFGFPGLNGLWMEANPRGHPKEKPEQFHFNNLVQVPFYVGVDKINPLLDVTFDGIHILNGDIVSAKPDILVQLKDENLFLALNDTADFKVWLRSPGSQTLERIYFADPRIYFTSAQLPKNSCRINFKPNLVTDGKYELLVQAKDRSKNLSGSFDYRVTFEVENKPSITEVMNYPNPFSTSTRFVFTLTGSEIPEDFTIQILTITGKVVREITRSELGHIHIGRNITEYAWDGKDDFGDPLANGLYLYRVKARLGGQWVEKKESGADPYFHKGFGKMYLIR